MTSQRYEVEKSKGQTSRDYIRNARDRYAGLVMNSTEAAALIGVKRETLMKWRREGIGPPFVKLPVSQGENPNQGRVRYLFDTVMEWLASHEHQSISTIRKGKEPHEVFT